MCLDNERVFSETSAIIYFIWFKKTIIFLLTMLLSVRDRSCIAVQDQTFERCQLQQFNNIKRNHIVIHIDHLNFFLFFIFLLISMKFSLIGLKRFIITFKNWTYKRSYIIFPQLQRFGTERFWFLLVSFMKKEARVGVL